MSKIKSLVPTNVNEFDEIDYDDPEYAQRGNKFPTGIVYPL